MPEAPSTAKQQGVEPVEKRWKDEGFPVFLRTLQGRHHVISCTAGMLLSDLQEEEAVMPPATFLLLHRSKILQGSGFLGESLSLTARLLGGSGILGKWHCSMCNRGGWWHTKAWCFRCGTSRAESETLLRGSAQGHSQPSKGSGKGKRGRKGSGGQPQREQSFPGTPTPATPGPQFAHAPTFHAPRPNQRRRTDTAPPQKDVLPELVEILRVSGCSQEIWTR